ncbi:MAG: alpha/beta hydrolase [Verrucomicrobiota bacterium JB022]|nr:alpha/beta hydrolase [Verrucomicrobiota bacterium JB022]
MHGQRSRSRRILSRLASHCRWNVGWVLSLAFVPLTGCRLLLREPKVPMPHHEYPFAAHERQSTLLVFLPGRGDRPEQFADEGLLEELRAANAPVDVWAVDAHLNYYYRRTIGDRLREDVLAPARELGYERIYVVGISLGGLGALMYEVDHGRTWDGIILLAPYLGEDPRLFAQIEAAGGPEQWTPPEETSWDQFQFRLWGWLGSYRREADQRPPVWLGVGADDRFRRPIDLFAESLPPERVYRAPGAHRWPVWRELWREILPETPLVEPKPVEKTP